MRPTKVRKTIIIWGISSSVMGNVNLRTTVHDIARQNYSLVFLVAGHVRFRRKYNTLVA